MRPTLLDVAIEVGVDQSTVSRCLRDHPRHSPQTIEAVKAAAAAVGYVPPWQRQQEDE